MTLWISIAVVTLVTTALVVWPLVRTRRVHSDGAHDDERRLAVFRDRKREIDRERAAGRLTDAEAGQAHADLVRQLADDLPELTAGPDGARAGTPGETPGSTLAATRPDARTPRTAWLAAALVVVLVPLVAIGVYRQVGTPQYASVDARGGRGPIDAAQIDAMIDRIEQRTREHPEDGEAWAMLAEARKMQGRHDEAIVAFVQATERIPDDARLLTDYAESVALRAGGEFAGQPVELLERALAADPGEPKAVALMGAAQYRLGDLPRARTYLRQLEGFLEPGSEEAMQIAAILRRIEGEIAGQPATGGTSPYAGAAGTASPPPAPLAGGTGAVPGTSTMADIAPSATAPPPAPPTFDGTVSVDPALAERAQRGGTLFVIARASGGSPVPIAVLRVPAPDFPASFRLDDSNAMDPSRGLSVTDPIDLEARLSRSGQAMREPGDLYGRIENVQPGSSDLRIVLDKVVSR